MRGQCVRPRVLGGLCNRSDVRDIGRELDHDGDSGVLFDRGRYGGRRCAGCPKGHAAGIYIGAGDVDLNQIDLGVRQFFGHGAVFFYSISGDIGNNIRIKLLQKRQFPSG